ncbi:MAG: 50S ribosomal protein L29 [bacterium]|jgi:large subunit ribosomal protein L29
MKPSVIRDMTDIELENRLRELKEELFNLRFQKTTGQLKNTARIKEVKKDIARILTIMHLRRLGNR